MGEAATEVGSLWCMPELTGEETVQAADRVLHDVGTVWMIHDETRARGEEYGYAKA